VLEHVVPASQKNKSSLTDPLGWVHDQVMADTLGELETRPVGARGSVVPVTQDVGGPIPVAFAAATSTSYAVAEARPGMVYAVATAIAAVANPEQLVA